MPLSVEERRRLEGIESTVSRLEALVEHAFETQKWERPPVPEYLTEDRKFEMRSVGAPAIPPAAMDQMIANLSDADKQQLLQMFTRALKPSPSTPTTPAPDVEFFETLPRSEDVAAEPTTPKARK